MKYSWPAQALIHQTYSINSNGNKISSTYRCGGTLIRKNVVMTAAHCFRTAFKFSSMVQYTPNSYNPTIESTFSIYLGLHDTSLISSSTGDVSAPAGRFFVSKIIPVV